ncbi:MAG: hypothetical protein IPO50_12835, partial [Sphingomonadales bacterium]|nr:hypothetical protein [Sphingomonadales bacterium]
MQREHPEWHLPDISNPRLDYRDLARRDRAIHHIVDGLMGDLRNQRIDELADVGDVPGKEIAQGINAELGILAAFTPPCGQLVGLLASPMEGGTLLAAPDGPVDGAKLAREPGLGVKPSAQLGRMDGELVPAMGVVAEEATALGLPRPVVTSGNDSTQHALVPLILTNGRSTSVGTTSLTHKGHNGPHAFRSVLGTTHVRSVLGGFLTTRLGIICMLR